MKQHYELAPARYLFLANGIYDIQQGYLSPPKSGIFVTHASPVAYDDNPPTPQRWIDFLASLWGNDSQAISTLGEFSGLALTDNTAFQKLLLIIGPKRSGKGTIGRILQALLGKYSVAWPTMSTLGGQFGLGLLVDKALAVIADAQIHKHGNARALEILLSITGEDTVPVNEKYKPAVSMRLLTRFLILSNKLPLLEDSSGAFADRCICLHLTKTWLGREDLALEADLLKELPGILKWAIEGYIRLRKRGHFLQPVSGMHVLHELRKVVSPILEFTTAHCRLGPQYEIAEAALFKAWKSWCYSRNEPAGWLRDFRASLYSIHPLVESKRRKQGESETRVEKFIGIAVRANSPYANYDLTGVQDLC